MFEVINFVITQLWRIRKCLQQAVLADYAPDSKTAADVTAMISAAEAAKTDFVDKALNLAGARGEVELKLTAGHNAAVRVYAGMRSIYRRDPVTLRKLRAIPKKDGSAVATLARMQLTSDLWAKLPVAPGTDKVFRHGKITKAVFDGLYSDLETKHKACVGCEQEEGASQAALTALTAELTNFTQAAISQGRSLYDEGTPERSWIDTIPTEPSQQAPDQAVITVAASRGFGAARLEFEAKHATSYTVKHRGPGDADYAVVAEDVSALEFDAIGLKAGEHLYIVIPHNSRGHGPASEPKSVTVKAAQVA